MNDMIRAAGAALLMLAPCLPATAVELLSGHDVVTAASTTRPLPPDYRVHADGSVTLRICYNWSCAKRETLRFSTEDMASVKEQMALCPTGTIEDRLQRLRIGIWKMEELAAKYQPLLLNDQAVNDKDRDLDGRTDCVDNATNTTTYLNILQDLDQTPGWRVVEPEIRNRFDIRYVHWTATVVDKKSRERWSVDSWFRPNGHLPFVMPLENWVRQEIGWEPPFDRLNPYPRYSNQLCTTLAGSSNANATTN
jgi:hypothetical protein